MRIVVETPGGAGEDVELVVSDPDATVAELVQALGDLEAGGHRRASDSGGQTDPADPPATARAPAPGVIIDGRFCHGDLAIEEIGLYEGARLSAGGPPEDVQAPAPAALELRVVGGLDAGRRLPLRAGTTLTVGREPDNDLILDDLGVSRHHAEFSASSSGTVTVTDLDSANGTWIEGHRLHEPTAVAPGAIVEAGDVALVVAPPKMALPFDPMREVRVDGTAAFNRPPRARGPEATKPLALPEAPPKAEKPTFSVVAAVGPLVMGGVMVVLLHNIMFAAFMLLSPILTIGGYFEQRRKARQTNQGSGREFKESVAKFRVELADRREDELSRLREVNPDIASLLRRAAAPEPSLWERRAEDADFLLLSAGFAKLPFQPSFSERTLRGVAEEAEQALERLSRLPPAPVDVDLSQGGVVGVVGPRAESLAVARALLCQAAILEGPADLQLAVFTDSQSLGDWEFAKWLPHARDNFAGGSRRQITCGRDAAEALISALRERRETDPRTVLAVIDAPELIEGRGAAGRTLLREGPRVSGIIVARTAERLPANCNTVIELTAGTAEAKVNRPQRGELLDPVLVTGVSAQTAGDCARALARFEDADLDLEGGTLPTEVELLPLLGLAEMSPEELGRAWERSSAEGGLIATIAVDRDGPFGVDLVRDGPHGLIAGTTGSGKSEMLRSLVAALAARYSPERLNFVLIDYKGGSAFARCAELPHTVGMVTDLDEQLGARALTSMEAELRFRERYLRDAGADDVPALNRLVNVGRAEPLPRLVVIIDEFATLASELPDFVASLVGIAQRGRSLGVHLLLATQRPSGAVSENIRANTNIRVCLRVQTTQDSSDVIDDRIASTISRIQPGRAYVRLGPGELDPIQTALVTGPAVSGELSTVRIRPFQIAEETVVADDLAAPERSAPHVSSLDLLVDAANRAHADTPAPRRPWLEPLAEDLGLEDLLDDVKPAAQGGQGRILPFAGSEGLIAPLALLDDPAAQAQYPAGWNLDAGNLLIYGIGGSGTTTALRSLAVSLALSHSPDQLHLYVMDFGAGELAELADLPHVGAVIAAAEAERQSRLIRMLRAELTLRREHGTQGRPRIVVFLDGYAGFVAEHSDVGGDAVRDEFARLFADGPEVGIHVAIAADRPNAVPSAIVSLAQQRLVMALADTTDYAGFGIRRGQIPRFNPGRAVLVGQTPMIMQIARSRATIADIAAGLESDPARPAPTNPPPGVGVLPARLTVQELLSAGASAPSANGKSSLWLPVGIENSNLTPAGWSLYPGEHALVSGPARTGRTNALIAIAQVCGALHPEVEIAVIGTPRSALLDVPGLWGRAADAEALAELVAAIAEGDPQRHRLLLIDDADAVDDSTRALAGLLANHALNVNAIAAGRPETFRQLGHWSIALRAARNGLLLNPDPNLDGGPLGIALPRRPAPPPRPGCGYLVVSGVFALAQSALAEVPAAIR